MIISPAVSICNSAASIALRCSCIVSASVPQEKDCNNAESPNISASIPIATKKIPATREPFTGLKDKKKRGRSGSRYIKASAGTRKVNTWESPFSNSNPQLRLLLTGVAVLPSDLRSICMMLFRTWLLPINKAVPRK
ncbi:hypothetical protein D9M68_652810 [compost metagenome]